MAANDVLKRRYDFVLLFDVLDGNPNGDPDNGNIPRMDEQTQQGLVTDGCLKRKIRNAVAAIQQDDSGKVVPGYDLYFQTQDAIYEKRVLNLIHKSAWDALGIQPGTVEKTENGNGGESAEPSAKGKGKKAKAKPGDRGDFDNVRKARQWMCQNFYDIRAFGAVMTTGVNCGQVRGPMQLTFARSHDPIIPLDLSITRVAVTREEDANIVVSEESGQGQSGKTTEMGRKAIVPYGLYRAHGFFNPHFAKSTGVTAEDLDLFWQAVQQMWDLDHSASRGLMSCRGVYVFSHESHLGNAPAHMLFERVTIQRKDGVVAPRSFGDYTVTVNDADLPAGVTLTALVG